MISSVVRFKMIKVFLTFVGACLFAVQDCAPLFDDASSSAIQLDFSKSTSVGFLNNYSDLVTKDNGNKQAKRVVIFRCPLQEKVYHQKWSKTSITYKISNYPDGVNHDTVRRYVQQAFGQWSNVTNLSFPEVTSDSPADIEFEFKGSNHHKFGFSCSFKPEQLTHSYFPENGEIHFDSCFFKKRFDPISFQAVTVHQIGHALGLIHDKSIESVMYPDLTEKYLAPQPIDVQKIQRLYGYRSSSGRKEIRKRPR